MNRTLLVTTLFALTAAACASASATTAHRVPAHRTVAPAASAHAPAKPPGAVRPGSAARTLDDIHIEGEIPVPQVLFITARDQRRFLEFQPHRYLRSSRQLAEATLPPGWIVVTRSPLTPAEEISR